MSSKGIAGFNTGLVRSVAGGYTPTEWATGDVITAEKLNKLENGVADASDSEVLKVRFTSDVEANITADKTFEEIRNAYTSGKIVIVEYYIQPVNLTLATYFLHYRMNYFYFIDYYVSTSSTAITGIQFTYIRMDNDDTIKEFNTSLPIQ